MSRKPRLTDKDIELLLRAAILCPGEKPGAILAKYIELEGRSVSISTVEKKLAKWRNEKKIPAAKATLPTEERPLGFETPWSLGVSARPEYGIPPEATDDLLAVWKYCLVTGHLFTIREAKWLDRLRKAITDREGRIAKLLGLACEYALREQICEILKKPMDTRDLDGDWSIDKGELLIFQALGLIPRLSFPFHPKTAAMEIQYELMSLSFNVSMYTILNTLPDTLPKPIFNYEEDLKTILTNVDGLSEQQDRIYSASLLYLSKGPLWKTLSKQQYLLILAQLKQWITRDTPVWQPAFYLALDIQRGIKPEDVLGPNLLKAVGYEVRIEAKKGGTT